MANIYKNEKTSLTTTALTTLYTVPSNSRAIVKSLNVAEDAGSTAVVKVTLVDAASAIFVVDNDVNLTANQKEQVLSEPLIMKESEILNGSFVVPLTPKKGVCRTPPNSASCFLTGDCVVKNGGR